MNQCLGKPRSLSNSVLVFDQIVTPAGDAFSDSKYNDWLASRDDVAIYSVIDRLVRSGSNVLAVGMEETADEESVTQWASIDQTLKQAVTLPDGSSVFRANYTESIQGRPALGFRRVRIALLGAGGDSAHVRVWATLRGGHRAFHRMIFDERLEGTAPLYPAQQACTGLQVAEKLALTVAVTESTASTVEIQMEESPNGTTWSDVEHGLWSVDLTMMKTAARGLNIDGAPPTGWVRFRVQLTGTGTPVANVRLWATGRTTLRT